MKTMKCAECGAEFVPNAKHQKYCLIKCYKKAKNRRDRLRRDRSIAGKEEREAKHALAVSASVPNETIMTARRKPANTSAIRWRMELRRRLNPKKYACAVI